MNIDPNVCRGVLGPCSNPVTHNLGDPDGKGPSIPLCDEHWSWALALEKSLGENPEFEERFSKALNAVEKSGRPTRYQRKPVI